MAGQTATIPVGLRVPGAIAWPLVLVGLGAALWGAFRFGQGQAPARVVISGPRIEEVRRIAQLAVLRVQVANVLEGANAGAKAAVLVKGDADIALDLEQVEIAERDDAARTALLRLPPPRPERPRVDHERTRLYELRKTGLAALNPFAEPRSELLADAMRAAQTEVARAVADPAFIAQARTQAELLLTGFYRELGWTVRIEWRDSVHATVTAPLAAAHGIPHQ